MRRKTFFAFVAPSLVMMLLFIAAPLAVVVVQSFQNTQRVYERQETESCLPSFPDPICTKAVSSVPLVDETGAPKLETVYVGWANYLALLRPDAVAGPG